MKTLRTILRKRIPVLPDLGKMIKETEPWPDTFPKDPEFEEILPIEIRGRLWMRAQGFAADHGFAGTLQTIYCGSSIRTGKLFGPGEIAGINKTIYESRNI